MYMVFFIGVSFGLFTGVSLVSSQYDNVDWNIQKVLYETKQLDNKSDQILAFNDRYYNVMSKLWENRVSLKDKEDHVYQFFDTHKFDCTLGSNYTCENISETGKSCSYENNEVYSPCDVNLIMWGDWGENVTHSIIIDLDKSTKIKGR